MEVLHSRYHGSAARGEVLDRVVAVVNGELVLESDIEEEKRFSIFQPLRNPNAEFSRAEAMQDLGATESVLEVRVELPADVLFDFDQASLRPGDILLTRFDVLNEALDSGRDVLRLHFLRGDGRQVREVLVRLEARVEAAA